MRQNVEPVQEIKRLQRCMSDLVSVLALPAAWNNSEPNRILETSLDALVKLLDLDFLYARAKITSHEEPIEVLRTIENKWFSGDRDQMRQTLSMWLGEGTLDNLLVKRSFVEGQEVSILPLQLGIEGSLGLIVAGCHRLDFPLQTERLVVNVAANQLAIMLQQAQLLKRSEEKYRVVVETASDAVISMSERGVITLANAATKRIFGYEPKDLIGKSLAALMPESMRRLHEIGYSRYLQTGERRLNWQGTEVTGLRANGEEFPAEVSFGEMTADGQKIFTGFIRDISEKKRAEEAVLASERNLSLIINTMPVLAWSARPDGSRDFINQRWLNYTGMSQAQAQDWGWAQALHPEDQDRLSSFWRSMIASGESGEIEARLRHFSGNYRWFLFRADPLRDDSGVIVKWYGTNTDIDDRKRAEEALREREINLRQITETIPEMLWSASPDGAIDYCNGRLLEYTGFSSEEVMQDGWMKLLHPDFVEATVQMWTSCIKTGNPYRVEVHIFHAADKTYRWCVASALPLLDEEGRIVRWHGTVVDMHDWKKAQEEIRNTQAELAKMMRVTTLGQLTASIAHEVNQPLSGIITNASTCLRMLNSELPNIDGARETARRTLRDGNRASEVIARLRKLFNRKEVVAEAVDLNEAAREVMALLLSELQGSGVILQHAFADNLPIVKGDRIQLQQVILNLLRNASDAMSSVDNRPKRLVISTELDGENVRLMVKDSGIGFEPAAADRLFESFYTTKREGMGIGLSVSRSIIEAHRGRIWATANDGPGATLAFSIPCEHTIPYSRNEDR